MSKDRLYIFDTTLRDGAQTQGVDFSLDDKEKISSSLDTLGVDYIEGGWPGANPTDTEFFNKDHNFKSAKLTSFGMTKKTEHSADNDPMLSSLINSKSSSVCLFGKSWDFQVDVALGILNDQNLSNISESAKHIVKSGKEFIFDAEHFFDGYKSNPEYAISCLKAAYDNGARWIVLCDTNGGTLPHEVDKIVKEVIKYIPGKNLGIHAHNDTENAVANSLVAVQAGVRQVQGTLNGLGERCGNANLVSLIPTFFLKKDFYEKARKGKDQELFISACQFVGLFCESNETWEKYKKDKVNISEVEIQNKIELRNKARKNKDYKEADRIRDELLDKGVLIEDKDGTTLWKFK